MRRGRRIAAQLLLLPAVYLISLVDGNLFTIALSITILAVWPGTIVVASALVWFSRQDPEIESLVDAADNAVTLMLVETALAVIALATLGRLVGLIDQPIGQLLLVGLGWIIVLLVFPALTWLRVLKRVYGSWAIKPKPSQERPQFGFRSPSDTDQPTESDPRDKKVGPDAGPEA